MHPMNSAVKIASQHMHGNASVISILSFCGGSYNCWWTWCPVGTMTPLASFHPCKGALVWNPSSVRALHSTDSRQAIGTREHSTYLPLLLPQPGLAILGSIQIRKWTHLRSSMRCLLPSWTNSFFFDIYLFSSAAWLLPLPDWFRRFPTRDAPLPSLTSSSAWCRALLFNHSSTWKRPNCWIVKPAKPKKKSIEPKILLLFAPNETPICLLFSGDCLGNMRNHCIFYVTTLPLQFQVIALTPVFLGIGPSTLPIANNIIYIYILYRCIGPHTHHTSQTKQL